MDAIVIHKGDDSGFNEFRGITVTMDSGFSLEGCGAEFRLQNFRQIIPDISSGTCEIIIPKGATRKMVVGESYGRFSILDSRGMRLTILDELLFEITTEIDIETPSEETFSVVVSEQPFTFNIVYPYRYAGKTTDRYDITGYVAGRTLDLSDCTFGELCNLFGAVIDTLDSAEVINSWELGGYALSTTDAYAVTGYTTLQTLDLSDCTLGELCNLVGSLIASLDDSGLSGDDVAGGYVSRTGDVYSVTGYYKVASLDLTNCSLVELCNVIGTIVSSLEKSGVIL